MLIPARNAEASVPPGGDQRLEIDVCNQRHDADAVVTVARF
jgi:hypothetical protein